MAVARPVPERWAARHRGWWLPLAGALACYAAASALGAAAGHWRGSTGRGVAGLGVLALFGGAVLLAVLAVRGAWRVWRAYRRAGGHFTKAELIQWERHSAAQAHWAHARALAGALAAGQLPAATETVWGLVLEPGERILLDTSADYARYYGMNIGYTHVTGVFWGSVPFMAAGYGATALANRSRRSAAQAAAVERWREHQPVRLLVTERRLLCQLANARWLSFYYNSVQAMYPEPENWSVVFDFQQAEPLRIGGLAAPSTAVIATWALHGASGVRAHPGLAALRTTLPG